MSKLPVNSIQHCGNPGVHDQHTWAPDVRFTYWCAGLKAESVEEGQDLPDTVNAVDATDELLASRRAVYGDRVNNMERAAALWSALLGPGREIKDWEVPLLMSAYKMMRTFETPDYSDNSDDIDGWKKMFVEVMDKNHGGIIQARTVEEYQAKKDTPKPLFPEEVTDQLIETMSQVGPVQALLDQSDGQAIAAYEGGLVHPGQTVYLDGGLLPGKPVLSRTNVHVRFEDSGIAGLPE